jgi:hypothetical protein
MSVLFWDAVVIILFILSMLLLILDYRAKLVGDLRVNIAYWSYRYYHSIKMSHEEIMKLNFYKTIPSEARMLFSFKKLTMDNWLTPEQYTNLLSVMNENEDLKVIK